MTSAIPGSTQQTNLSLGMWPGLVAAFFVGLDCLVTLVGSWWHLTRVIPNLFGTPVMPVYTALQLLGLAAAVAAIALKRMGWARPIAVVVLVVSLTIFFSDFLRDEDIFGAGALRPVGWFLFMDSTEAVAACSALLAASAIGLPRAQPSGFFACAAMAVAGFALLGHLYGAQALDALSAFRGYSVQSAVCLLCLSLALLVLNEEAGVMHTLTLPGATGRAARRQLAALALPPIAAMLLLRVTTAARFGARIAIAILVVLTVIALGVLIFRAAQLTLAAADAREDHEAADAAKILLEERYRSLFRRLDTGFCVVKVAFGNDGAARDFRFIEANPAFARQSGIQNPEGHWIRDLVPNHERFWFDIYGKVARTGEPMRFENAAEALGRYYDVYAFRVGSPEDPEVAVLFNDISDRRRAELDLEALNATLEQRATARAVELEAAKEALRQAQKLEAIGQLTGGVAHDFNNLLTVIKGSVELLKRPNIPDIRRDRYIEAIGGAADRAAKLTSQLLAFARRQALNPEFFELGACINEIADMVRTLIGSRVILDVRIEGAELFVLADRAQFDAAIVNMAVNARDAMDGSGKITITSGPVDGIPSVRAHEAVAGEFVACSVADTGTGIPPEQIEHIFEPFFTTKAKGEGTGLGLSQVIGFAKQSGGDVNVTSKLGEGTIFTLYLPRVYPDAAVARPGPEAASSETGEGLCVLVVEDNQKVGEFAVEALEELGYESRLAADATEALAELAAAKGRFHAVFSDVVMPGMDGIEFGEQVRVLYPDLPVILTSGYSHVLAKNGEHGFALLHKPYSVEQLSRVLKKAVQWRTSRQRG